ncbi:MAG TPA: lipopolysaccharide heptosyltransferase II [Candidatus Saccharimonadales bacterium]|nr:lipopolysaccharide heptosyltransferase II [Candidatus Saccharimonadales bacterium]
MQPEKIVVRGVNWLGDAVMTTPALQRLREAHPGASITILTPEKLKDLWLNHPDVDQVLAIEPGQGLISVANMLRRQNFSLGLAFPNSPRSALELYLGRVRRRVGYARPWRNWCLTDPIAAPADSAGMRKRTLKEIQALITAPSAPGSNRFSFEAHHIHNYLRIVEAVGGRPEVASPRIHVTDTEVQTLKEKWYAYFSKGTRLWFGLNPGAEYGPAKRWPAERYAEAAVALCGKTRCSWMVFGGAGDSALGSKIAQEIESRLESQRIDAGVWDFSGQTTLRQLCILLKICSVVLTNDSGPMHLAAALGKPVVVPFGSTSPELTGPGLPGSPGHALLRSNAPCAPCFLRECPIDFRCMGEHTVEQVVAAVLSVWKP